MDVDQHRFMVERLVAVLPKFGYMLSDELSLQSGIAEVLDQHGITFEREVSCDGDRFDFLCQFGVVIEVKTAGSWSAALRQAERYCRQPLVAAVVLASTRRWTAAHAVEFHGKPVQTIRLRGRLF